MSRYRWAAIGATVTCGGAWIILGLADGSGRALGPLDALPAVPLVLGWLLVVRAPATPVGPVLTWLAASMLVTPALESLGWWFAMGTWSWQLAGFMALLAVFPDGLRWRSLAVAIPAAILLMTLAFVVTQNHHDDPPPVSSPISVPEPLWEPVIFAGLLILLTVVALCVASVVTRYRAGDERVREQLRWLILAAVLIVVLMTASWIVTSLGWLGQEAYSGFLLGITTLVPAAVTIAVLRHDLFEIDQVLSDSLAWLLTTGLAALALAGLTSALGTVLDARAGLTGSVFLVALAVLPLHRVIHQAVARVIDRDRAVLLDRVRRFVDQVRDGSAEPERVEAVLREATGDPQLALLLADPGDLGFVDLAGEPATADGTRIPLRTAGTEIGVLVVSPRSQRRLRRARLAAAAASLPIEVSRLRLGLRRALAEVADSRRRLVTASVEERRRLERDLHDGAQQQLVALGMQLRSAQSRLPAEHAVVAELDAAVGRIEQSLGELRRLAHGVRPSRLDDGLAAALNQLGQASPVPVTVAVDPALELDEVVATTAYFVVAEAVANAMKHAGASSIEVCVQRKDAELVVRVKDDGVGGVDPDAGLTGLRDRVRSIGGRLTARGRAGSGTAIEAVLPCES